VTVQPYLILLVAGLLVFLSIASSKLSERFGVPALLMFLGVGMLAGSDGPGGIHFDNASVANLVGTFALVFILFSGGLDTNWRSVRPVLGRGFCLSTLGVALTAGLVGLFAWKVLHLPALEGFLLAAIISSTDAAAVFGVLRSRGVGLQSNLRPLLEVESGSNDPMAVFLTLAMIRLITGGASSWVALLPSLVLSMGLGLASGLAMGWLAHQVLNRLRFECEGLYPGLSMSLVLLGYGLSELVGGNGFLAVYACGLYLGNHDFMHKHYLAKFHDGLAWLMQIGMFLVLGLLVFPSRLPAIVWPALLLSVFLMVVARPLAIHLCLLKSQFTLAQRTLVAWAGLKGAVPIVLATFPYLAGYEDSDRVFNIVFFIVLSSVLLQGRSLMLLARWLHVDEPQVARPRYPLEFDRTPGVQSETREVEISPDSQAAGQTVAELGLPPDALILLIRRGPAFLVPRGKTRIEAYDTLMLIGERDDLHAAQAALMEAAPRPADPAN